MILNYSSECGAESIIQGLTTCKLSILPLLNRNNRTIITAHHKLHVIIGKLGVAAESTLTYASSDFELCSCKKLAAKTKPRSIRLDAGRTVENAG